MKKLLSHNTILVLAAAMFLTLIGSAPGRSTTVHSGPGGRLIVWRSPVIGTDVIIGVTVDGRRFDVTYGGHFETILSPGRHVVGIQAFPQPYPQLPNNVVIHVRPGELFNFTAKGGTTQIYLKRT